MSYTVYLTLLNVCVHLVTSSSAGFNVTEIAIMTFVQSTMCDNYKTCGKVIQETNSERVETFVNDLQFTWPKLPPKGCCQECSCDIPTCVITGTCCPDILDQVNSSETNYLSCEAAQMRKEDIFLLQAGDYFFMRTKCHPDYAKTRSSSEVISLCELRTEIKLEIHVPVLDTITNVTYANKYCAQCNFATDPEDTFPTMGDNLVYWDSSLQCTHALEAAVILKASNQGFNIEAILQTKTCNVIFKPKPVYKLHTYECSVAEIDRCNFTGDMTWYEPWLEKACKAYISIFHVRFKNVFCSLCNTDFRDKNSRVEFRNCDDINESGSMKHFFPEFSSLLAFTPDKNKQSVSKATGCTSEQGYDKHEGICRNISCLFPKQFNGSECVNFVNTLGGVSYTLYLKFTPQTPFYNDRLEECVGLLENKITEMLQSWELYEAVHSFAILYNLNESNTVHSAVSTDHPIQPYIPTISPELLTFPSDVHTIFSDVPTIPPDVCTIPPDVHTNPPDVSTIPPDVPTISPDVHTIPPDVPTIPTKVLTLSTVKPTIPSDVQTFSPVVTRLQPDVATLPTNSPSFPPSVSTFLQIMTPSVHNTAPNPYHIPGSVTIRSTERTTTVAAQSESIEYFLFRIKLTLKNKNPPYNVNLLDKALAFDETSMVVASNSSLFNFTFDFEFVDLHNLDKSNEFQVMLFDPVSGKLLRQAESSFKCPLDHVYNTTTTVLNARFKCPLVVLNFSEIDRIESNTFRMKNGAVIDRKYINYKKHGQTNDIETFEVCWDVYQSSYNGSKETNRTAASKPVTATGILSLGCMIISVTCLLITLVTYFLFNELRTQPGINNMGLVISLIIAQVLFQFGKDQHANVPSRACALIGALVHFFWLLVIFWMNVCCWHMFRTFTNMQAKSFKQSYVLKTCVYTVYAVVGSLLFVAINIIVTVVYTDNLDVGYGDGSCYISMRKMVGYAFALPVFLIILANLVMFCIVVFKIKRNSTVQNSVESKRNYLKIFAKLSTLTGLSWIFGFIYTYTEISVFVYLFIILSNGQGVFIFISFVCSKRVYNLYRTKLCAQPLERREIQLSSISTRTERIS